MLIIVSDSLAPSPLGTADDLREIVSRRSANEKPPWKSLPGLAGTVEEQFVRPVLLGENLLPFRLASPVKAVIPHDGQRLLELAEDRAAHVGLADWWSRAEAIWNANRSSDSLTLMEQIDYRGKLRGQLPAQPIRLVYAKSGIHLAASVVLDPAFVIDHKLYWAAFGSDDEARFLEAILNSTTIDLAIKPLQARGKDSPRDIDKYVWQLPIPVFSPDDPTHLTLVSEARAASAAAAAVELRPGDFRLQRKQIRNRLIDVGIMRRIDEAVARVLGFAGGST